MNILLKQKILLKFCMWEVPTKKLSKCIRTLVAGNFRSGFHITLLSRHCDLRFSFFFISFGRASSLKINVEMFTFLFGGSTKTYSLFTSSTLDSGTFFSSIACITGKKKGFSLLTSDKCSLCRQTNRKWTCRIYFQFLQKAP